MLKLLPFFLALVVTAFMFYNPLKFSPLSTQPTSTQTVANATQTPPDGQLSDYNLEDVLASSGDFDSSASSAVFNNQPIDYPSQQLADAIQSDAQQQSVVLGATTNSAGEEKWVEVDLDKQQLTAWEGNKIVKQFLISSGLWNSTHRGTFNIWLKTKSQRMKGGSKELGTYYDLPNVPNNMFFDGERALHGAYWHHNFGHVMSHGCVNEPLDEAAWMFDWAGPTVPPGQNSVRASADNPGTRVWVH